MFALVPRMSEKAYGMAQGNVYVFNVPLDVNKKQIAARVAEEYDVEVVSVNVVVQTGKRVRFNRGKRAYPGTTQRSDRKKAYVTLKEGNNIPVFADAPAAAATTEGDK